MASGSVSGWARAGGGGRSGGNRGGRGGTSIRNSTAALNRRLGGNSYMAMNRANRVRGEANATVNSRYY